jgi:hypothetical protein
VDQLLLPYFGYICGQKVQANMAKSFKTRASKQKYVSPTQGLLPCFEMPFSGSLLPNNRWVVLAGKIPWDILVNIYQQQMNNDKTGAGGINPRVALGSLIIKHICDLSDRETIEQIRENVYMQYFIGYSSFSGSAPFDPSLFVELRKRLDMEQINAINERIISSVREGIATSPSVETVHEGLNSAHEDKHERQVEVKEPPSVLPPIDHHQTSNEVGEKSEDKEKTSISPAPRGKMIVDATVCPQDIAYPTDLNLLNDAREKAEELIDVLYQKELHGKKPRTYRHKARKFYLAEAQKKNSNAKAIRKANGKQLAYLRRDIGIIHRLLDHYPRVPFDRVQFKYFLVIQTVHDQQEHMYRNRLKTVEHRIVSIHQPHVRPIVRGKRNAKVEFGAKIQVSQMNGFSFLDDLDWEAFNEGKRLMASVGKYRKRFGYYPAEVLADKIYCTRENRRELNELGIKLRAKPLGRPSSCSAVEDHVRPGERNPIEGVFGQGKTAYGMNRIKARLAQTSASWIATILMVINLVKITGLVSHTLNFIVQTFSAWAFAFLEYREEYLCPKIIRRWDVMTPAVT